MYVPLQQEFHFKILAAMNSKKSNKQPLFAEVELTGDEFKVLKHIKSTKPEDLHKLLPEEWEEQ